MTLRRWRQINPLVFSASDQQRLAEAPKRAALIADGELEVSFWHPYPPQFDRGGY